MAERSIIAWQAVLPDGSDKVELVSYYDKYKTYIQSCEMKTKKWVVDHVQKDWVILDCGAYVGYYTILFARLAPGGYVYAFEPTTTYDMLLDNLQYNKLLATNITPLKLAVGKETGEIEDSIYRVWGTPPERKTYDFITIDDFVTSYQLKRVDLIKIDTDSFDFEVLQGAERTLRDYNPFVIVEIQEPVLKLRGYSGAIVWEWLKSLGYENIKNFGDPEGNFLLKR